MFQIYKKCETRPEWKGEKLTQINIMRVWRKSWQMRTFKADTVKKSCQWQVFRWNGRREAKAPF